MSGVGKEDDPERPKTVTPTAAMHLVTPVDVAESREFDLELLMRACAGEERAVCAFYRKHVDVVYRHVARVLGPNDSDIEDVVQKVFLAALDGGHRFAGRSKVRTWLLGIATRRALDETRSRYRRHRWHHISERVGLGRPATPPDVPLEAMGQAEAALAVLTPDQRVVFVLHEVEEHTLAEISAMTKTGISTLHARLKAARKRLDVAIEAASASASEEQR